MQCDEELTFEEACLLLQQRGLPLPEEAENFLTDVQDPAPTPAHHGQTETEGTNSEAQNKSSTSKGSSSRRRRVNSVTSKLASFYVTVEREENGITYTDSVCKGKRCGMTIGGTSNRGRRFHAIICPDIDYGTRHWLSKTSSDKDLPPLLRHPPPGLTTAGAKKLMKTCTSKMLNVAISDMLNPNAWSIDPIFSKFAAQKVDVNETRPANEASDAEQKISNLLLMRFIVEENIPFNVLSRPEGRERSLAEYVKFIRSGINLPSSKIISSDLLDEYCNIIEDRVRTDLINQLCGGYGTLMFDSSEDENLRPITSVLLRVTGGSRSNTKTYYLDTVFTGTTKSNAELYKKIATDSIQKWVGFKKMCAIVTDNTANVKKAREDLMNMHGRLVASQDQAHVADKLMKDIGEISWIDNVITTLSFFAVHYRKYRKVKMRLEEKIAAYNCNLRRKSVLERSGSAVDRCESNVHGRRASTSDEDQVEPNAISTADLVERFTNNAMNKDDTPGSGVQNVSLMNLQEAGYDGLLEQVLEETREEDEGEEDIGSEKDPSEPQSAYFQAPDSFPDSESSAPLFAPEISGYAKTMKKMSRVRFASAEKLLEEYRSVRKLLIELVNDEYYDSLYSFRTEEDKTVRDEKFVKPILDDELYKNVLQAHGILRACRTYLRIFDKETALISEVYEATRILEQTIYCLPEGNFPKPRKENKNHLLRVFKNRKEGPLPGMKRVRITLLADLHYAAALLDPFRTPREDMNSHLTRLRRHMDDYYKGEELNILGKSKEQLIQEMVTQYGKVRDSWRSSMLMRQDGDSGSGMTEDMKKR